MKLARIELLAAALFTALVAAPLQAQVFKCKGPNGVVYQDGPCESGAAVDTRSPSGVTGSKPPSRGVDAGPAPTKPTHPVLPERLRK